MLCVVCVVSLLGGEITIVGGCMGSVLFGSFTVSRVSLVYGLHLFSYIYCLCTFSFGFADLATSGELYTSRSNLFACVLAGFQSCS